MNRPEVMFTRFFCQRLDLNLSFKLFQLFVRRSQELSLKLLVGSVVVAWHASDEARTDQTDC